MTEHQDHDPSVAQSGDKSPVPENGRVGRRFLLAASTPFVVTLANRSAMATGSGWSQICSPSAQMSVNLSRAATLQPGQQNCGVSPGCWKNNALDHDGRGGIWQLTGSFDPTSSFATVFQLPSTGRWKVSGSSSDLYGVLCHTTILKYKLADTNNTYVEIAPGTVQHFVASLLNAAAWGGSGHYPHVASQVIANVASLWQLGKDPTPFTSSSQPTTAADNIKAIYELYNGDSSDPCGPYL